MRNAINDERGGLLCNSGEPIEMDGVWKEKATSPLLCVEFAKIGQYLFCTSNPSFVGTFTDNYVVSYKRCTVPFRI